MEGFSLNDIQALSINRNDDNNGSFRKKKELVSVLFQYYANVSRNRFGARFPSLELDVLQCMAAV